MRRVLVIGARGLLGRALMKEFRRRRVLATPVRVNWREPLAANSDLEDAVAGLQADGHNAPWTIIWAAGAGVTSTPRDALEAEQWAQNALVEAIKALPAEARNHGTVFYASSAGGLYAGSKCPPFNELTAPAPLGDYGYAKLQSESAFATLGTFGVNVVVGRLANLYGPGQDLSKQQGLISQLSWAHHSARPLNIYVSLDTLRDYLYVDDAARGVVDLLDLADARTSGAGVLVKILASGRSVSLAALLGEMNRITKRHVPVILAASPQARQQARDLRLQSVVLPQLDQRALTPLAEGMAATNADVGALFRTFGMQR